MHITKDSTIINYGFRLVEGKHGIYKESNNGNPKANMASTNQVLDKVTEKKRGMGVILCLIDKKIYLRENLVALPIGYI